jgi:hypothetical protein
LIVIKQRIIAKTAKKLLANDRFIIKDKDYQAAFNLLIFAVLA